MTEPHHSPDSVALELVGVRVERDGRAILDGIDWSVGAGERWVVLGPNGSGKTTLVRLASLYLHPTAGTVRVLGGELGRVDVRRLRRRIGVSGAGLADLLRPTVTARDVVMTAKHAALEPWWHTYEEADRRRAGELLERMGVHAAADRPVATLSSGERQRVLLARTLMTDPGLLLLDEPTAALDVGGREELVARLDELASDPGTAPMVLVTHHLEEVPPSFTHALLVRGGGIVASGPIGGVLTAANLTRCFTLDLDVGRDPSGRWWARAR